MKGVVMCTACLSELVVVLALASVATRVQEM